MDVVTRISDTRDQAPVIRVKIASDEIAIKVFFNMNCCIAFLESHKQGDSYRSAFAKSVYIMHTDKDEEDSNGFAESGFENISDEDFSCIINSILENDISLKAEYEKTLGNSQYERFYKANEEIIESATKGISTSLKQVSWTFDNMNKPLIDGLQNFARSLEATSVINMSGFQSALAALPEITLPSLDFSGLDFSHLKSALSDVSMVRFPELSSTLAKLPPPAFDIQSVFAPLEGVMKSIQLHNENMFKSLEAPLLQLSETIQSFLSSIDFSLLLYPSKWSVQREALLSYGWFYTAELPEDLVANIYEKRDELSQAAVNKLIASYFRKNKCAALKQMIQKWEALPYFKCRELVFSEALVNHTRRCYNSSVMMLTLHTEGVITDYVRLQFKAPKYYVKSALSDIKNKLEGNDNVSLYEFEIFSEIIDRIQASFSEGFDYANPDIASNLSRDKIAHGHAYDSETEVNSVKQFLYLNEVYHLMQLIIGNE